MRITSKALSVILLGSILSVSCGAVTPVPTITPTFTATATSVPTISPTPSPTATLSRVNRIFVIPTMNPYQDATPTPIATPALGHSSMQLRDLSEDDFLNFVFQLQERSYQNFPPHMGWWTEGQFVSSQELVALAIQEYLYHFPNSLGADRLRWQLAFIDSIRFESLKGNDYYDEWIVEQLQNMLNQGEVLPENLESVLDRYWFDVDYFQSVDNLFGDGVPAWFYVIRPQVWKEEEDYQKSPDFFDRGGLFVVVREVSQGVFQLYILENAWSFSSGSSSLFEISDFNDNSVPEIALNDVRHSGTMCGGKLWIFEWRHSSFVDLTKGDIQISDCADNYEYSLIDNVPSIILNKLYQPAPSVYTWNGMYYELSGYQYSGLIEKWKSAISFSEEAEAIEEILASENLSGLSPAQIDFLRYRLGILYALDSEAEKSRKVLQELVEKPLDVTRTIYSELAINFLKHYSGDKTLYLACLKSLEIPDKDFQFYSQEGEDLFGVSFDLFSGFGPGLLGCFSRDVFELLVRQMPTSIENVPEEMSKNNVNYDYYEKQDVNLDGVLDEWVFIIDDGIFVVFPDGQFYNTVVVGYFWYGEDTSKYSQALLKINNWNGIQEPVLAAVANQELLLTSIGENYESTWLGTEYDISNILFTPQGTPSQYQVFHTKPSLEDDYYDPPWEGYRWDSTRHEFRDDLLEYILFIEHNPNKAAELVKTILPLLIEWKDLDVNWWFPRYYYLSGLSYELSGDAQKAAEIYWQIWHDYPDSPYALMAQYKLEPVSP